MAAAFEALIILAMSVNTLATPTESQNLVVTTTNVSASLSWTPPLSDGGRDNLFYIIKYKTQQEQQFTYYSSLHPSLAPLPLLLHLYL